MFIVQTLLPIFWETVLPVFLIAFAGYLLAWRMSIDGRSLGRLLFYLATPALVFRSLYSMTLDPAALRQITFVAALVITLTGVAGWLVAIDRERHERVALVLTSAVSNNGNMGIPISLFAFGPTGMALASIYYVVASFMNNTVGVVVASSGQASLAKALQNTLSVPVLYTAILGLLLNRLAWELPVPLYRSIDLLADAAIPGMLALLGINLRAAPKLQAQGVLWRSLVVRLCGGPVIAWLLCLLFGIVGVERNVLILQAAMPTAVISAVLATEFDAAPHLVTTAIFMTTLVSMGTLSVVLWLLL
jgi:predicted permease